MRAVKKFKQKKGFNYKELHQYFVENGLNVCFSTVVNWCITSRHKQNPDPKKHTPKLVKITGYAFEDFYQDPSERQSAG
jgi:hypothetical protein